MKKGLRISSVLCLAMVLFMGSQGYVHAAELPNLKNMDDFKDVDYEKLAQPLEGLIKEAGEKVKEAVKDNKPKYGGSTKVDVNYSKVGGKVLGKVVVIYEDTKGNVIKTKVKTDLELKTYEEKAIGINGFKLVSKTSQKIALTEGDYEQVVVFVYKKCANPEDEDPVKPDDKDPVDPEDKDPVKPDDKDPVDPDDKDPVKPDDKDPVDPEDKKLADTDGKDTINTETKDPVKSDNNKAQNDKRRLPKTGSSASVLVGLGSLLALSGGLILKKKK